jgi:hypothetical protein
MIHLKAPDSFEGHPRPWIFLAGSIEGGRAEPWQERVVRALEHRPGTILNPRREDWKGDWKEEIGDPRFRQQVTWELAAQHAADRILMYFVPDTKSPITLLELGLSARSGKLIVCCPPGYWRKGNVDAVCSHFGVPTVATLEELYALSHE